MWSAVYSIYFIALFSLTAAAPLTPEAVTAAVKKVYRNTLCWCLCVPPTKHDEILANYPPEDHSRVLVDWWFFMDPTPSWRRLIHQLDCYGESEIADKIRHNVEPVEGTYVVYMHASVQLHVTSFILLSELLAVLEEAQSFELGGWGPGKANICLLGLTH